MKENVLERMERLGTKQKIEDFMNMQKMDYEFKVAHAENRALAFVDECKKRGLNYHVSVGGLDSITLLLFLRSIGIDAPAISASHLEDVSIQRVHKQLGVERLAPMKRADGTLRTTGAQRTGCAMCGFGIHMEKRPNRFDALRKRNQKEWEFLMKHLCTDENGEEYGWGKVLDYIGIGWEEELL